jgi:hypothetical protein
MYSDIYHMEVYLDQSSQVTCTTAPATQAPPKP